MQDTAPPPKRNDARSRATILAARARAQHEVARCDEELAELEARGAPEPSEYSTTSGHLPAGVTARTLATWCRTGRVPGAVPDGRGWRCSREAWHRARAAAKPSVRAAAPPLDSEADLEAEADAILEHWGLRPTRTG